MRAEDPRPEPDIERPGLAADIDGRRDIANAILADQSGADHGEAAQGRQQTWLLPCAVRERMGRRRVPPKGQALLLHPTGLLLAGGEFSYVVSRPDDIDLK